MDKDKSVPVEDPPDPDLDELQQRNITLPAIPVQVDGVATIRRAPSRLSAANVFTADTKLRRVLGNDPRRTRTIMMSSAAWLYSRQASGTGCPWPASVALYLEHCDEVYAAAATGTADITVIQELYAE
jgi:hypothetical protein